jgi:hypothetical protein
MATPTTYSITSKAGAPAKGQAGLVYERFALGACTIKEVVAHLEGHPKFVTVQTPERIAAYYICVLKKSGHIAAVAETPRELPPHVDGAWLLADDPTTVG